eukprot:1737620-Amphidinium_carterae.1
MIVLKRLRKTIHLVKGNVLMLHAYVPDGIQSGSKLSRLTWHLEPTQLEPTPTQRIGEGMGAALSGAGFCKCQGREASRSSLSCLQVQSRIHLRSCGTVEAARKVALV